MVKILVYGYGNPGRQDDGLGVLFAEKIEEWAKEKNLPQVSVSTNYQLNIEDAYGLDEYKLVLFADASKEDIEHFKLETISPTLQTNFSMHSVSPAFVLGLCNELYQKTPQAYLLHIQGYHWEFMEPISAEASKNLGLSLQFLQQKILSEWVDHM